MRTALPKHASPTRSHKPRAITVFAAAFVAGAAAAVGVNRTLDVRLAQSKPRVESEAIFVALRSLPQGSPVTVWDVALRDWPKAMLPATALRASDTFSGHVLKHPLREGQPLLSIQLSPVGQDAQPPHDSTNFPPPASYTQSTKPVAASPDVDFWSPAEPVRTAIVPPVQPAISDAVTVSPPPPQDVTQPASPATARLAALADVAPQTPSQPQPPLASSQASEPTAAQATAPEQAVVAVQETMASQAIATPEQIVSQQETATQAVPVPSETTASVTAAAPALAAESTVMLPVDTVPANTVQVNTLPVETAPQATIAADTTPSPATVAANVTAAPIPVAAPVAAQGQAPAPAQTPPLAPLPISNPQTAAAPAPTERPRPTHQRFLVVPERIAVQADASFTARVDASEQATATVTPQGPARPTSEAVRPLPATSTVERRPQGRPQGRPQASGPQGMPTQRQGRQSPPATTGAAAGRPAQPRFGSTMFPNISAGIDAIEGRLRSDQSGQSETSTATQAGPVTAR